MHNLTTDFETVQYSKPAIKKQNLNFVREGHYVIFDGQEALIEDFAPRLSYDSPLMEETYYFQSPQGIAEDAKVKIDGVWHDFDSQRIKPVPVSETLDLPSNFIKGARIRMFGCDDTVQNIYLLKTPEDSKGRVTFDCNVFVNCEYNPRKVHIFTGDGVKGYSLGYART